MDKSTLSNYGWIVIAVLVLAVMIALATPFGSYIENGVRSTTQGLFDTSEKAMNVVGMSAGEGSFASGSNSSQSQVAGALHNDGTFLTWDELKLAENGDKYNYDASAITDTSIGDGAFFGINPFVNIVLPETLTRIGCGAFEGSDYLVQITIPVSVTDIDRYAFVTCELTNITYGGTVAQWNAIQKGDYWNDSCPEFTVTCTDGTITIPATNI